MKNLRIAVRMGIGYAVVLCLLAVIAGLGINRMAQMHDDMERIVKVDSVVSTLATSMRTTVYDRMIALRNIALLTDNEEEQAEVRRIRQQEAEYADVVDKLGKHLADHPEIGADVRAAVVRVREDAKAAAPIMVKAMDAGLAEQQEEAIRILLKELRPVQLEWTKDLGDLIAMARAQREKGIAAADETYAVARAVVAALALLACAIGGACAYFISRGIVHPLRDAVRIAQTVAGGDLTSRIGATTTDETGQLLRALKDMNDSLLGIVREVRGGTETIASASEQIASGNADLSSRTEQQASSLEETASSMQELTSTVRRNADSAVRANALAASASEAAIQGGAVVADVVGTMGAINESARKIGDIIGVIDSIAFQTNILALNAAVEAARAGEQGRGFAVVASEVRTLAQRSAAAAKDIKTLIGDSVARVDAGSLLVEQAGATMNNVVDSIRRVTDLMGEISAASQEQSQGIEQVSQAVAQMEQVTQQNAALVEEAAAASDAMREQARHLADAVGVFRLDLSLATPAPLPGGKVLSLR